MHSTHPAGQSVFKGLVEGGCRCGYATRAQPWLQPEQMHSGGPHPLFIDLLSLELSKLPLPALCKWGRSGPTWHGNWCGDWLQGGWCCSRGEVSEFDDYCPATGTTPTRRRKHSTTG